MTTKTINERTGTEIVSVCTKCKLPLAHTIVAMDGEKIRKVRCNTCGSEHRFVSGESPKRALRAKPDSKNKWEALLSSAPSERRVPYSVSSKFREKDLIDHPFFGVGIIVEVMNGNKMRVIFQEGEKILACGRSVP